MALGFYFDATACTGCRTCQVACKDAHNLPVGTNYRVVRTFVTGSGYTPSLYHVSMPVAGCDLCKGALGGCDHMACVTSCPQRVIEFGDLDELRAAHAGEEPADAVPAVPAEAQSGPNFIMRIKPSMLNGDFEELVI